MPEICAALNRIIPASGRDVVKNTKENRATS
jgi:hypothetical protein